MDSLLEDRLRKIEAQIKKLAKFERRYLGIEAARKTTFAILYSESQKKTVADKQYDVEASADWAKYMRLHASAEADYLNEKRIYDLLVMVHYAEQSTFKVDAKAIKMGVG